MNTGVEKETQPTDGVMTCGTEAPPETSREFASGVRQGRLEEARQNRHDEQVKKNKTWRRQLDGILQEIKEEGPSRERSITVTKMQEAIMWLGMDLKRLGEANPYPNSKNPSNAIVDPTADKLRL